MFINNCLKKIYLLFGAGIVISCLFPGASLAEGNSLRGLTVTPAFQQVDISNEKDNVSFDVAITNNTSQSETLHLQALDFGSLNETGGIAFLGLGQDKVERKYGLASWLHLDKDVMSIDPGQTKKVTATIENKESLAPGGHYGAILFTVQSDPSANGTTVAINQSFSTLIFAKKTGGEVYKLEFKSQDIPKTVFKLPSQLKLRFQNSGNVHVVPRGIVAIDNSFGQTVAQGIINEDSSIILPETYRLYSVTLKKFAQVLLPGSYTVNVQYRYDGSDVVTTARSQFLLLDPIPLIGLILLVGVGYGLIARSKKTKNIS